MHAMTKVIFQSKYQIKLASLQRVNNVIETTDSEGDDLKKTASSNKKRLFYSNVAEFITKLETPGREQRAAGVSKLDR